MWRMGGLMQDAQKAMVQAKADMEADRRARTVAVSAADLLREFQTDPAAADRKFQGKYLELTGVVERTGRDRNGISFVVLHAGDAGAKVKVECFFDDYLQGPPNDGRIARLTEGQKVTVRGEYTGQVSNVQVHQCSLVE
jgi:hypothetical protein